MKRSSSLCSLSLFGSLLILLVLLTTPRASAQPAQSSVRSDSTPCKDSKGKYDIHNYEVAISADEDFDLTLFDSEGNPVTPLGHSGPTVAVSAQQYGEDSCAAYINFESQNSSTGDTVLRYPIIPATNGVLQPGPYTLRIEHGSPTKTYHLLFVNSKNSLDCLWGERSFLCPTPIGGGGNGDYALQVSDVGGVRVSPNKMWFTGGTASNYIDEGFGAGDGWVWPYHADVICAGGLCESAFDTPDDWRVQSPYLLMPVDAVFDRGSTPEPLVKRISESITLPSYGVYEWTEDWLTLAFAPGAELVVQSSDFSADGQTFTASDPQGWDGITFTSTSVSVLNGVTVDEVADGSSVTVVNAALQIASGSLINGKSGVITTGVSAYGGSASVEVEGVSRIEGHNGYGVFAGSGGYVIIRDDSRISGNGQGAVRSTGSGSEIRLKDARLENNFGAGGFADAGGLIDIRDAFASVVSGNYGGLKTDYYAQIDGGMCVGGTCTHAVHDLSGNSQNGTYFDAEAIESSTVVAEGNYWAQTSVSNLILVEDATSTVSVEPLSLTPSLTRERQSIATTAGKGSGAELFPGVQGLTLEALRRYNASENEDGTRDPAELEAADVSLVSAFQQATASDEHARAFGTAAWLLAREPLPVSTAWVESHASLSGARQPWVLRALLAAQSGQGRTADARSTAATLASDYAGTEHETVALIEGVRLAVAEDDWNAAFAHLATLELLAATPIPASKNGSQTAERRADAVEIARLLVGLATSGESPAHPEAVRDTEANKTTAETVPALSVPVPNPTRSQTALTLTLSQDAYVRSEVLDLLGRSVLVLADGQYSAGRSTLEVDTSALPAGMYFVRVSIDGAQSARLSRRLTVVR